MKRAMIVALVTVVAVAGPIQANAESKFQRAPARIEHHQPFERSEPHRFHGHVPYRVYGYAPSCAWTQGYWGYQPYVDASGQGWYVPQWVPPQYVCY